MHKVCGEYVATQPVLLLVCMSWLMHTSIEHELSGSVSKRGTFDERQLAYQIVKLDTTVAGEVALACCT